jgi:insertion element IS1 protein InsB
LQKVKGNGSKLTDDKVEHVLELDEVWSFAYCSANKRWLWTALCRRTRQIVAFVSGDHSAKTCAKLWAKIPESYKCCHAFSDFWNAYAKVFPKATHRSVAKGAGDTTDYSSGMLCDKHCGGLSSTAR